MRKTIKTRLAATTAAAAIATVAWGSSAAAEEIRYAFGFADTYPAYPALINFSEAVAARTDLDIQIHPLSLLSLAETPAGIRDRIADAGWVNYAYTPVEYSEANLMANLSMLVTSGAPTDYPAAAMTGATMEYIMLNCPGCIAQFAAQGQVYLGGTSVPPYQIVCNNATIVTAEDVEGKRIRSGAGNFTRWAQHFGATPVSLPGNEIYDGLSQGVVDCSMTGLSDLIANRYIDVTNSVTLGVPGGVYSALGIFNVGSDIWAGLSDEQRGILIEEAARLVAEAAVLYDKADAASLEAAKEKGHEINEAAPEFKAAQAEFVTSDLATIEKEFTDAYRVENVGEKLALAQQLIEKWKGLVNPVGDDVDALTELYRAEVFSKLDPANYGMN